jgi:hypothetical protein
MRKPVITFIIVSLFIIIPISALLGQDTESSVRDITSDKMRVLILPGSSDTSQTFSIDKEVTGAVASVAVQMGRFEVIDRTNLESILAEKALQQTGLVADSDIVELGKLASSERAITVNVLNFSQAGIPPAEDTYDKDEEDSDFWSNLVTSVVEGIFSGEAESDEPFANNIQTQLAVEIKSIDITTGKSEKSMHISVSHTGGPRGDSRARTIEKFREALYNELCKMYSLFSEVISVEGNEAILFLGAEVGVKENTLFEIREPDVFKMIRDRQVTVPGRSKGMVCVTDLSSETNRSQIIREWRMIREGDVAMEYDGSVHGLQVYFLPPWPEKNFRIGGQFHFRPIAAYDFGLELYYSETRDSYDKKTRGFGVGGFGAKRLLASSPVQINAKLALDLDIFFKKDDEDHIVTNVCGSLAAVLNTSIMLNRSSDMELNCGYRFSGPTANWVYSAKEETYDAVWDGPAPKIDLSGWFFTVGYKYVIF